MRHWLNDTDTVKALADYIAIEEKDEFAKFTNSFEVTCASGDSVVIFELVDGKASNITRLDVGVYQTGIDTPPQVVFSSKDSTETIALIPTKIFGRDIFFSLPLKSSLVFSGWVSPLFGLAVEQVFTVVVQQRSSLADSREGHTYCLSKEDFSLFWAGEIPESCQKEKPQ